MLEHGFVCVGTSEPSASTLPVLAAGADGAVAMQIIPPGWNAVPDSYSFGYVHPLRGSSDTFTVKALAIGSSLAVHAASSSSGADLLTITLGINKDESDNDPASVVTRAKEWQERTAAGVALRLLGRQNSTARLGKSLEAQNEAEKVGTKRPAPEDPKSARPDFSDERDRRPGFPTFPDVPGFPQRDPFVPGFLGDDRPIFWTPDGGLLGPRHPAWGQVVPGRLGGAGGSGGMLPRFDPIGPGNGEPNPDLHVPGIGDVGGPRGVPGFGRRGRMDPDGMFMM
eukprot:CAMPEP_0197633840 /NCGR_PEP_ID=MMETSP1338-20131121/10107_1 /TAXON_ID=43686 ORGANISM="Pelagodinium beii, Strain RCC1491" /NCGR_SAMPLE_ID=MMETSP1338 /ASSEMBLY_ACC=CAM_ASM_000754 /LENGTH=281 /DNA_ID=CAMNT_0043205597 /DNA_START=42 /DNA_END=887 /DNA_ORIENTATION=+